MTDTFDIDFTALAPDNEADACALIEAGFAFFQGESKDFYGTSVSRYEGTNAPWYVRLPNADSVPTGTGSTLIEAIADHRGKLNDAAIDKQLNADVEAYRAKRRAELLDPQHSAELQDTVPL